MLRTYYKLILDVVMMPVIYLLSFSVMDCMLESPELVLSGVASST